MISADDIYLNSDSCWYSNAPQQEEEKARKIWMDMPDLEVNNLENSPQQTPLQSYDTDRLCSNTNVDSSTTDAPLNCLRFQENSTACKSQNEPSHIQSPKSTSPSVDNTTKRSPERIGCTKHHVAQMRLLFLNQDKQKHQDEQRQFHQKQSESVSSTPSSRTNPKSCPHNCENEQPTRGQLKYQLQAKLKQRNSRCHGNQKESADTDTQVQKKSYDEQHGQTQRFAQRYIRKEGTKKQNIPQSKRRLARHGQLKQSPPQKSQVVEPEHGPKSSSLIDGQTLKNIGFSSTISVDHDAVKPHQSVSTISSAPNQRPQPTKKVYTLQSNSDEDLHCRPPKPERRHILNLAGVTLNEVSTENSDAYGSYLHKLHQQRLEAELRHASTPLHNLESRTVSETKEHSKPFHRLTQTRDRDKHTAASTLRTPPPPPPRHVYESTGHTDHETRDQQGLYDKHTCLNSQFSFFIPLNHFFFFLVKKKIPF